jgi:hypothetical protein
MHNHHRGGVANARDRRDILDEIVTEPLIQRGVDRIDRVGHEERVSVGGRAHHRLSAYAGTVLHKERLAEPLGEPLAYQARREVGDAARGSGNNDTHRPSRISLRPCDTRGGREDSSTHCQSQKSTARKFHDSQNRCQ